MRRQQVVRDLRPPVVVELSASGRFETSELAPGSWKVFWAKPDGGRSLPRDLSIAEDAAEVEIQVDFGLDGSD